MKYYTITEASRETGIPVSHIQQAVISELCKSEMRYSTAWQCKRRAPIVMISQQALEDFIRIYEDADGKVQGVNQELRSTNKSYRNVSEDDKEMCRIRRRIEDIREAARLERDILHEIWET